MLIDWFTVVAQAINFLILVWLMKHFLYKPILHAIDEREKKIAAELSDAETKKSDAKKESDEFKLKNVEFDQQRAALLAKAESDAHAENERLLLEASKAATALSLKRQETLKSEANNLNQAISLRTQREVFDVARKVLTDLAGASLEGQIVEAFVRRLHELSEGDKTRLVTALKTSPCPVIVRSAFALPPTGRTAMDGAIKAALGAETEVQFELAPNIISGIEVIANGQKVGWSISDYLGSLEKDVDDLIKTPNAQDARSP